MVDNLEATYHNNKSVLLRLGCVKTNLNPDLILFRTNFISLVESSKGYFDFAGYILTKPKMPTPNGNPYTPGTVRFGTCIYAVAGSHATDTIVFPKENPMSIKGFISMCLLSKLKNYKNKDFKEILP